MFTARSIFSVDTGFRLSDDQYVTIATPSSCATNHLSDYVSESFVISPTTMN